MWGVLVFMMGTIGCAVPQPRGEGTLLKVVEPTTNRRYYLYLPKDYVEASEAERAARRWPLVLTCHGMKPYDIAYYQAREWQQEADRFGFIAVAPYLRAFDFILGQFPQRTVTGAFKSDENAILAILDHVFQTTHADPNNVLATGFSAGGYMAHYLLNQHPDRFTCLGVRQANFAASVLKSKATAGSLYHPILILSTQNDFGICKRESREAIEWYESHGYRNLAWVHIRSLGHARTPDTAADFFARVAGVAPNRPPAVLMKRQAIDGNPRGLALLAGNLAQLERAPGDVAEEHSEATGSELQATARRAATVALRPVTPPPAKIKGPLQPRATPQRKYRAAQSGQTSRPLAIRVSSAIGFEPLALVYSVDCPSDWHRTADFYWTLDGKKIGLGVNGQRTIAAPGDHMLGLLVVTSDGTEHRASRRIRVLSNAGATDHRTSSIRP